MMGLLEHNPIVSVGTAVFSVQVVFFVGCGSFQLLSLSHFSFCFVINLFLILVKLNSSIHQLSLL